MIEEMAAQRRAQQQRDKDQREEQKQARVASRAPPWLPSTSEMPNTVRQLHALAMSLGECLGVFLTCMLVIVFNFLLIVWPSTCAM